MLDIKQIASFYPPRIQTFKRSLLREYLQYKILESICRSGHAGKMVFMGGTAIHMVHASDRFSEDLDFDNKGLDKTAFIQMAGHVIRKLKLEGYSVQSKNIFRQAFRSYLGIEHALFDSGLSPHKNEKLTIRVDTQPQNFSYQPAMAILNKFDVFVQISVAPVDLLAAQKIYAALNRKRSLGRDFYDLVFLLGKTAPNMSYLQVKLGVRNVKELKEMILARCEKLDFRKLAREVTPFLYDPADASRVLHFMDYLKGHSF